MATKGRARSGWRCPASAGPGGFDERGDAGAGEGLGQPHAVPARLLRRNAKLQLTFELADSGPVLGLYGRPHVRRRGKPLIADQVDVSSV